MAIKIVKHIKLSLALIMSMTIAGSCNASTNSYITTSYKSSSENFPNPERGFFTPFDPRNNRIIPLQLSELQKVRSDKMSLVRRIYLLLEFRDKPISQSYLDMMSNDFNVARQAGVKLILRFSYNWSRGGPDAPRDRILSHLDQLKPILQNNYDVISYMEAGFIGYWGEWNKSTNNLFDSNYSKNITDDSRQIYLKILSVLPPERMVALRYPKHKHQIFNNYDPLTPAEAFNSYDRARTGGHNDSFRASIGDGGTYGSTNPATIEQLKSWLNFDTRYVVQGGEPASSSNPPPPEYDDCAAALADFARMHWSTFNVNQDDVPEVYHGWIDQGCMEQIKRSLGYRFRLLNSTIPQRVKPAGTFSMKFTVVNDGWASPYNPRSLEVILRNRYTGKQYYLPIPEAVRMWMPGASKEVSVVGGIPAGMPAGEYQVLLNLPDPTSKLYKRPQYSIRLANQNVWEDSTGYNSLLRSFIVDPNVGGDSYSGNEFFKSR